MRNVKNATTGGDSSVGDGIQGGTVSSSEVKWSTKKGDDVNEEFVDGPEETIYQSDITGLLDSANHPFDSNLWYQDMKDKVRKLTNSSCYACSMMPKSTSLSVPFISLPFTGGPGMAGVPAICMLLFQHILHNDVGVWQEQTEWVKANTIIITLMDKGLDDMVGKTTVGQVSKYNIYSNLTLIYRNTSMTEHYNSELMYLPDNYPSLSSCPSFFRKHVFHVPIEVHTSPVQVSASVNASALYDVCVNSSTPNLLNVEVGRLRPVQCARIIILSHGLADLSERGLLQVPNFYWCCGNAIWVTLPRFFSGLCGMNELTYIVQPKGVLHAKANYTNRAKRGLGQYLGNYGQLLQTDPKSLKERFYNLSEDFRPFTATQMFFKSWFASTSLQYDNHYLIALTRHDLVKLSNETIRGFEAIDSDRLNQALC